MLNVAIMLSPQKYLFSIEIEISAIVLPLISLHVVVIHSPPQTLPIPQILSNLVTIIIL